MYRIKLADEDELVKKHLEDDGFITEVQKLMKSYLTKDAWDYTYKKGKSIVFRKSEIDEWLRNGKRKSMGDLEKEAQAFVNSKRKVRCL